ESLQRWLLATPWTPQQRTPFGDWKPVLKDVFPLGMMGVVSALHGSIPSLMISSDWQTRLAAIVVSALAPTLGFSAGWTLLAHLFWIQRRPASGYGFMMVMGVLCHLWQSSIIVAVICSVIAAMVAYVRANVVLQRVLHELLEAQHETGQPAPILQCLGGEFEVLSPQGFVCAHSRLDSHRPLLLLDAVVLLIWLTAIPWESGRMDPGFVWLLATMALFVAGVLRVGVVLDRLRPHLGLTARWATRQWIVPAYDRHWIVVVPATVVFVLFAVSAYHGWLANSIAFPAAVIGSQLILHGAVPTFQQWSLTAPVAFHVRRRQRAFRPAGKTP
ncbi:MAG: hypothetical protein KDA96_20090, partial [Planctomycetaceae bacterium]|nr:hypothetical protein [Planctomycetaceae bacterium]